MTPSPPLPIVIQGTDLFGLVPIGRAVAAVEQAYRDLGQGGRLNMPCQRLDSGSTVRVCAHHGVAPSSVGAGVFVHAEQLVTDTAEERLGSVGPPISIVYDPTTAALRGIVIGEPSAAELPENDAIAGLRTAATSVVGTLAMAPPQAKTLTIIGAGRQAEVHLMAFEEVRPFERIVVFSRTSERLNRFVARMQSRVNGDIDVSDDPADAVAAGDVVLTATNSRVPVLSADWLRPGQHVTSIVGGIIGMGSGAADAVGRGELDIATDARAAVIGLASLEQAYHGFEPLAKEELAGAWERVNDVYPYWDRCVDLADILVGTVPGRVHREDITIFKNNAGQGMADMAVAALALDVAGENEIGSPLV